MQSTIVPHEIWDRLLTERDLLKAIEGDDAIDTIEDTNEEVNDNNEIDQAFVDELIQIDNVVVQPEINKITQEQTKQKGKRGRKRKQVEIDCDDEEDDQEDDSQENRLLTINTRRQDLRSANKKRQDKNADRLVDKAIKCLGEVEIGTKVAFLVSEFDRGISDPPVMLCKIYKKEGDLYQLASQVGLLDRLMARNAFQLISPNIDFKVLDTPTITVREAVTAQSDCGGQGFLRCGANCNCKTKKCKCKAAGVSCNSRCHVAYNCPNCQN